jgi:hypothetical protein
MEVTSDLHAIGPTLDAAAHATLGKAGPTHRDLTLVHVKCDDLDLSSLCGVQILQDRLEQAIAEARWASAGF